MFFQYIFSAYLVIGIYTYFRINNLLISKGKKILFTILFIFLVAGFPMVEQLAHYESTLNLVPLIKMGFYTLPFLLYLFLLVLVFDIFLLINLILKLMPKGFLKSYNFRKWGLISTIGIPGLILIYGIINFNFIRISEYNVEIPCRSSKLNHLNVAFVTDFHIGDLTSLEFVEQFVRKLNLLNVDIILFGGDLLEGDRDDLRMSHIETLFQQVDAKYGKYGVFGNHERHSRKSSHDFYRSAGIVTLQDSAVFIDSSFYLVGRQEARDDDRLSIFELTENLSNDFSVFMLDHRPTDLKASSKSRVDIQFSGHTHHGQLFPFNLITSYIYEISWGHGIIENTHFFVSSGIQLWGSPVRTIGKSEIMMVNVHFTD